MNFPKGSCLSYYMNGCIFAYDSENSRNCFEKFQIEENQWYQIGEREIGGQFFGALSDKKSKYKNDEIKVFSCQWTRHIGQEKTIQFNEFDFLQNDWKPVNFFNRYDKNIFFFKY